MNLTREQERQIEVWGIMRPYATPDLDELAYQSRLVTRAERRERLAQMRLFDPRAYRELLAENRERHRNEYAHDEERKAKARAKAKAWYEANAAKARDGARARSRASRAADREAVNAKAREGHARRKEKRAA